MKDKLYVIAIEFVNRMAIASRVRRGTKTHPSRDSFSA